MPWLAGRRPDRSWRRSRFDLVTSIYDATIGEYGPTAEGVLWESAERQRERFDVLCRIIDGPGSVTDFGCGYGALFDHLMARHDITHYVGVDVSPAMIAAARSRVTDERAEFVCASLPRRRSDYTLASGVFAIRGDNSREQWWRWIEEALLALWERSVRGMAFNMLRPDAPGLGEVGEWFDWRDSAEVEAWCTRALRGAVAEVVTQPGWNDWAMLLRRA
jgi:SAM-dependent methyltransferase